MTTLSWHEVGDAVICAAYSTDGKTLFPLLTDYSIHLSREKGLSRLTVVNELRHIATFSTYLRSKRRLLSSVDDGFIKIWRDQECGRVKANPISHQKEQTSKRTVNAKLRRIYHFLWWYQESKMREPRLIGPTGCRVTSSGNGDSVSEPDRKYGKTWRQNSRAAFPLCFHRVGVGSKHRVVRVPTAAKIDEVRAILRRDSLGFVEQRNLLMLAIAEETGLRRAAINSLRIEQFSAELLSEVDGEFLSVTPDIQKFSYDAQSEFSMSLSLLILNFVEKTLKPLYRARGWSEAVGMGKLFVSERSGRPLDPSSLTRVFSVAFKRVGFGKGAAVHLMRHYFTNAEIVRETKRRVQHGLDTSVTSICASVSLKLHHQDPTSIQAYVNSVISEMAHEIK